MNSGYYINSGWLPTEGLRGKRGGFCSKPVITGFLYLPESELAMLIHVKVGKAALPAPKTYSQK